MPLRSPVWQLQVAGMPHSAIPGAWAPNSNRRFVMATAKVAALGILALGILAEVSLADALAPSAAGDSWLMWGNPTSIAQANPVSQSAPLSAFLNFGSGPYPEAALITTGNAQPWYDSTQIARFFGGQPSAQQADFDNTILQRVEQTFQQSGVPITLTDNPTVPAAHTLSLVANTASSTVPTAIGMTALGVSGFSFIDQIAPSAQTLDQLEWIVAHNVSHELMLAFGVGENYDRTGNYVDAPDANWAMMTSPNATFSSAASQALLAQGAANPSGTLGAQVDNPQTVPEPATLILWLVAAGAIVLARR
jgi:hypothetical protein